MYRIELSNILIAEVQSENEALSLALNYHFTMNVAHELYVFDGNDTLICKFIRK